MVKCPKCKHIVYYDVLYVEGYDYEGDSVIATVKAKCCDCGEEFWVKELFEFNGNENIKGE